MGTSTYYRLACDYDGTVDWEGAGREVDIDILGFGVNDYDVSGTIYRRAVMGWDSTMSVGSRLYRRKNMRLNLQCRVDDEDMARLIESWALLFPELWVPSRGFDCLKYYDDSDAEYDDMEGEHERPNNTPKTLFDDTDDYLYIGSKTEQFTEVDVVMDVLGVAGTIVWEYWDGDSWEVVSVTNGEFTGNARAYWTAPGDWVKYIIGAIHADPMYYIRAHASVSPDTNPDVIYVKRHRPISCYLMSSDDEGATWDFWYRQYYPERYYPNSFVIRKVDRILTTGAPTMYKFNIELVEANY